MDGFRHAYGHLTIEQHNYHIADLLKEKERLEGELEQEQRKFCDKPNCRNRETACRIEKTIWNLENRIAFHKNEIERNWFKNSLKINVPNVITIL
ncbi:MAG: hypothetical protein MRECE_8c029 [Mycoplasmataceae bacterium CE_OT135]|nr:MAG: hypothetical protein MRECE_8c029 [Mycoplasmataceae bacterium CE_OT135]